MSPIKKGVWTVVALLVVGGGWAGLNYVQRIGSLPAGYVSHAVCSGVFLAGREMGDVLVEDVLEMQQRITRTQIDGHLVSTQFGFGPVGYTSETVYRPGLGCARLQGASLDELGGPAALERDTPEQSSTGQEWPE